MASEYADKLRTLNVARAGRRGPKVTTDDHGTHKVDVTEHWNDRVDVNVRMGESRGATGVKD